MLTLYLQKEEIFDLAGNSLGWQTEAVKKPNNFYRDLSNAVFDWANNTVTYKGETFYMDRISIESTHIPTVQEWKLTLGNTIEYKYYSGKASEIDSNPSGNIENVKRILYKSNGLTKYIVEYVYDLNDRVTKCYSIGANGEESDPEPVSGGVYAGCVDSYDSDDVNSQVIMRLPKVEDVSSNIKSLAINALSGSYGLVAYPENMGMPKTIFDEQMAKLYDSENPDESRFNKFSLPIGSEKYIVIVSKEEFQDMEEINYTIEFDNSENNIVFDLTAKNVKAYSGTVTMGPNASGSQIGFKDGNNIVLGRGTSLASLVWQSAIPMSKHIKSIKFNCENPDWKYQPIAVDASWGAPLLLSDSFISGENTFNRNDLNIVGDDVSGLFVELQYKDGTEELPETIDINEIGLSAICYY